MHKVPVYGMGGDKYGKVMEIFNFVKNLLHAILIVKKRCRPKDF